MKTAYFDSFEITVPEQCVEDCSHQGQCIHDVQAWLPELNLQINPVDLARELKQWGAWSEEELKDHEANLERILWLACGQIKEDEYELNKQKKYE